MVEKMITKVFIFGLLCNVICRGFSLILLEAPSVPNEKTEANTQRDCGPKINSYKEKIPLLKSMLDNFTALAEKHKLDPADKFLIEDERDHVRTMTDNLIAKFDPDLDKLHHMSGQRARVKWCAHEMSIYLKMRRNLTLAGKQFKEDVLNILNHTSRFLSTATSGATAPHYPEHVRNDFDQVLSEIVNWLFIIDLGTNMMSSTGKLLKKLYESIRKNIKFEKSWTITKEGKVEVPEVNEIMYHDDEIKNEEFDKMIEREKNEISQDYSFNAADGTVAKESGVLEEADEAETAAGTKAAEVAKDEDFLDKVVDIFEAFGKHPEMK